MVVNKSRLSALFRKDAVPVLDKVTPPTPPPFSSVKAKCKAKPKVAKISTEGSHQMRSKPKALASLASPSLPTIPDASVPIIAPSPALASSSSAATYTMPTPPSFLSPFWYRPEEFGRLPESPTASRATSLKSGPVMTRSTHSYTRSEPFPMLDRPADGTSPRAWKRRMSGFFRHSISVVAGHKATH
ncbi:hypothetical protein K439DRAFT_799680 [Ramaria rubella]|nr:hypothetical protein K439DRAFT_799680 [Ramaria rubella]